jgi:hypothetical protein
MVSFALVLKRILFDDYFEDMRLHSDLLFPLRGLSSVFNYAAGGKPTIPDYSEFRLVILASDF